MAWKKIRPSLLCRLTDEVVRRAGLLGEVDVVVGRGGGRRGGRRLPLEEPVGIAAAVDGAEGGIAVVAEERLLEGVGARGDAALHGERGQKSGGGIICGRRARVELVAVKCSRCDQRRNREKEAVEGTLLCGGGERDEMMEMEMFTDKAANWEEGRLVVDRQIESSR